MDVRCPICLSDDVYKSRSANSEQPAPLRQFRVWVRCTNCDRLFHVRGPLLMGPHVRDAPSDPPTGANRPSQWSF